MRAFYEKLSVIHFFSVKHNRLFFLYVQETKEVTVSFEPCTPASFLSRVHVIVQDHKSFVLDVFGSGVDATTPVAESMDGAAVAGYKQRWEAGLGPYPPSQLQQLLDFKLARLDEVSFCVRVF